MEKFQKVAAHGFIVRNDGKFLITHRVETDDHSPNVYDLPGGSIEFGENINDALLREIKEETGLNVVVGKVQYVFGFLSNPQRHQFQIIYECKYEGGTPKLNPSEHDLYKWVNLKELENLPKIAFLKSFYEYMKGFGNDIYKSAGVIIKDRKILVEKDFNKDFYISPGGKLEKGESSEEALIRELNEELKIDVHKSDLQRLGHFDAPASGQEEKTVHMTVFIVEKYSGIVTKGDKVEKLLWINSNIPKGVKVGSIFEYEVIPMLQKMDLID